MTGTSISNEALPSSENVVGGASDVWMRVVGALVAGSLSALAGVISGWLGLYWGSLGFGSFALVGAGVGLILGFIAGPRAAQTRHPILQALGLTVSAAVLGWVVICVMSLVGGSSQGFGFPGSSVGDVLLLGFIGLPIAIVYVFPITAPVAFLGVAILRLVARSRVIAAVAVTLSISLVVLASVLVGTLPTPHFAFEETAAAVHLEWTVVNRSPRPLELGTFEHFADGHAGSVTGIEPCFTTTGSEGLGLEWFLTLDPESPERTPPELVSASQAAGSDVSVWVEIAADGTASTQVGRQAPSSEELTVDHCLQDGSQ